MNTVFCDLKVKDFIINEEFEFQENSTLASSNLKEIDLFGKVEDNEENILDELSFRLRIERPDPQKDQVLINNEHVYIRIGLPLDEIEKIEKQLSSGSVKLSFSVQLQFKQNIHLLNLDAKNNCKLLYFSKHVSNKNT